MSTAVTSVTVSSSPLRIQRLVSARLALRELTLDDLDDLLRLGRNPLVTGRLLDLPLDNRLHVAAFIVANRQLYAEHPGLGNWRTDLQAGGFAGLFSLMPTDDGRVEIGARLLPEHWSHGLAVEGGSALCKHAYETLKLPGLVAFCRPDHPAVPKVLLRLGFRETGPTQYGSAEALGFAQTRADWFSKVPVT